MTALVIVLIVTNLLTLAAVVLLRRTRPPAEEPADPQLRSALEATPPPVAAPTRERRMISVEILNPIELAGTRGRMLGIAGSLAPGITRRIVYDQTVKSLRQQLAEHHVVADVRVHTLRPAATLPADLPVAADPIVIDQISTGDAVTDQPPV
jgi:hypothetical protein